MLGTHFELASPRHTCGLLKSFRTLSKNSYLLALSCNAASMFTVSNIWLMAGQKRTKEDSHGARQIAIRSLNRIGGERSKTSQAQGSTLGVPGTPPSVEH